MSEKPIESDAPGEVGLQFFSASDELVSGRLLALPASQLAGPLCEARNRALELRRARREEDRCDPYRIAHDSGFLLSEDGWETAGGAIVYLGELDGDHRQIRINVPPVCRIESLLAGSTVPAPWDRAAGIARAVVAHELFHALHPGNRSRLAEAAAHAFARQLLRMPFSPLLYEWLLSRTRLRQV